MVICTLGFAGVWVWCVGARRRERRGGTVAELVRTEESAVRNVPVPDCYGASATVPGRRAATPQGRGIGVPSVCWVGGLLGPTCEEPRLLVSVEQCQRHITFLLLVREVFISSV